MSEYAGSQSYDGARVGHGKAPLQSSNNYKTNETVAKER